MTEAREQMRIPWAFTIFEGLRRAEPCEALPGDGVMEINSCFIWTQLCVRDRAAEIRLRK